jgi:hypothetical protein
MQVEATHGHYSRGTAVIDLTTETPISLAVATGMVPPGRKGKKTHLSTLLRWILDGAKAPDGSRVRLDAVRLGGRWMTSREALQRFADALTPRLDAPTPTIVRTPTQRQRAEDLARGRLAEAGI